MTPLWQLGYVSRRGGKIGRSPQPLRIPLGRIEHKNARLNAIIDLLDESALTAAQAADADCRRQNARTAARRAVTVKVNVDTKGRATTNGMEIFEDNIAPDYSPVVSNLLKAGAILIGRTNTPEMSVRLTTDNPLHGLTRNPWDLQASPGGSSGGAAAARAAGFAAINHGGGIAGSLRYPATACGPSTIKPGLGRVPAYLPSAQAGRACWPTDVSAGRHLLGRSGMSGWALRC